MTMHLIRRFTTKHILTAVVALAAVGGLVFGVSDVSAANHRQRAGAKIACVELRAGANKLEANLDELVQDGTITANQRTAIIAKISAGSTAAGRLCTGMSFIRDRAVGNAVLDLLNLDRNEIRIEWLEGKSLAEIAEAQGVDRQALIDTITTAIDTKLTDAVEKGGITADRKSEIDAGLPAMIEQAIDTHLSDVVDRLRDEHDQPDSSTTPISTTGLTPIA